MASVTRLEERPTAIMEPLMDGGFVESTIEHAHLWRCDGCGLVWQKRWHAETCAERGHKPSFEQGPYGVTHVVNGRLMGNPRYYTRSAVRRDRTPSS